MDKVLTKSKYDPQIHKSYYIFHMLRKSTSIYLVLMLGLVVIAFAINNTLASGSDFVTIMISWSLAIFTLIFTPILMMGRIRGIVKQETENRKDSLEAIEITKEKLTRRVEGLFDKVVFGWTDILTAHETKDCFFLYVSKESALVIVKADMVAGNSDIMRKLITNNMKKDKRGKIAFKSHLKEKSHD